MTSWLGCMCAIKGNPSFLRQINLFFFSASLGTSFNSRNVQFSAGEGRRGGKRDTASRWPRDVGFPSSEVEKS